MRKMIVIAMREYLAAVKTKAFIITLLAMPILMGGSIAVQLLLKDKVDTSDKRVAVLDYTGRLYESVAEAARSRNEKEIFKDGAGSGRQVLPRFLMEGAEPADDGLATAVFELSERVRNDEIMSFVIIGRDVIEPGEDPTHEAIAYHSNTPTYYDLRRWLSVELNNRIRQLRLEAAELDPVVVAEATRDTPVANLVPFFLMMLMFMVVLVGSQPLMNGVIEEKMQRIAEVLLGSIPPFQLMMGKLIGIAGVSLTLATFYIVGGFVALNKSGYGDIFPTHVVWWFMVFLTLAVLMFGSLFIAIGAAVSDLKEAQSLVLPVTIVAATPMFVCFHVIQNPNSTMSVVMSLIPPATPMLMVLRQVVPPGVPLWQPLLGIVLVLLTTLACVFAAGRIFRVGILMQGKGAKISEMLRWVVHG
ncbi:MAG: ABC transporter permease [Planctomycetota bacterium]|jgi:ABC-2 type transport system permease protein